MSCDLRSVNSGMDKAVGNVQKSHHVAERLEMTTHDWLQWKGGGCETDQSQESSLSLDKSNEGNMKFMDQADEPRLHLSQLKEYGSGTNQLPIRSCTYQELHQKCRKPHSYHTDRKHSKILHLKHSPHLLLLCIYDVCKTLHNSLDVLRSLLYLLLVFCMMFSMVSSQECDLTLDCHPPSQDLLDTLNNDQRTLTVSSTCGVFGTTEYLKYSTELDETIFYCNDTDPHPASYMLDRTDGQILNFTYENAALETYWQSANTISESGEPTVEFIVGNFTDVFLIRYLRAIFISPEITSAASDSDMRPRALAIEKKSSPTTTDWEPLRYYAESCATYFPSVPVQLTDGTGPDYEGDVVVCIERFYAGDSATFTKWGYGRQEVKFSPSQEFNLEFANSHRLQKHYMAAALRIRLVQPADGVALSSYYAVADLEIDGQCACFGHASSCLGDNQAQCDCQHNTEGVNCEECKPLYNNQPWSIGSNGQANACEDCGCNGHADVCSYDAEKDYGVCLNCREQTAGDKCDQCLSFYFVNPDKDLYNATNPAPDDCVGFNSTDYETYYCGRWCIPCNCSQDGSVMLSSYNCNNMTGQCECKANVQGRACDDCVDGFWNLDQANAEGCQSCACNSLGTFNNSNLCDKFNGECICKTNVMGQTCDQCKPAFYELSFSDTEGCKPCDCNPGASTNVVCPPNTGVCPCQDNIGGRTCDTPFVGYFGPSLDYLTYDAEFTAGAENLAVKEERGHGQVNGSVTGRGYVQLMSATSLDFTVSVPKTLNYNVIIRYKAPATFIGVTVTLQIADAGNAGVTEYTCDGQSTIGVAQTFTSNNDLPAVDQNTGVIMTAVTPFCLLERVDYTARITLGVSIPPLEAMDIDSLVLLPALDDLSVYTTATDELKANYTQCYDATLGVDLALRQSLGCESLGYSIMAELNQGAIECVCDGMGTVPRGTCAAVGGQCPCKPGVMLQDCSQCLVDYYGYITGDGCTACDCDPLGSVVTACNDTGICDCHSNVVGIHCDSCIPEHFGLSTGQGCGPCVCNMDYSINNSCADSGQCPCKPGVGGVQCDVCLDGYFNLTLNGCTVCECDFDGSVGDTCTADGGVCVCKDRTNGEKCDTCLDGFYGLGPWNQNGCLSCFCSGHSDNCTTAASWSYAVMADDWSLLDGGTAVRGQWSGADELDNPVQVLTPPKITDSSAELVMRIINEGANERANVLYFLATEQYLGDKRGAYGQNISVTLVFLLPDGQENSTAEPVDITAGDIILEGRSTTYSLAVQLPSMPNENKTEYSFDLTEDVWHVDTVTGRNPSYTELLEVLADIEAIKVRAKYVNVTDAITDLHSAILYYAEPGTASPINNIEQCTCPPEYTGQFCELCAVGYRHADASRGPYSECVLCDCNNHADPGAFQCDPETGVCNCTHNTMGDSCQLCVDGYYGDATLGDIGDCQPCMCPGNVAASDVNTFASVCVLDPLARDGFSCVNCTVGHGGDHCELCVDQWFGQPDDPQVNSGTCTPCECNTRADTCNTTTGECMDCRNDTAGQECDICAPGFFGIAASYSCQPCTCGLVGATGDCDHRNGDCDCKPNVITSNPNIRDQQCDRCALYTFNYASGVGCQACDCHEVGAQSVECDTVSGQCQCRDEVIGRQCDACSPTNWKITYDGCIPCNCKPEGTMVVPAETFGTCDLETGQCQCASEGIVGQTCDVCARGTTESYTFSSGVETGVYPQCELCGECYDNWALKIDDLGLEMTKTYNMILSIWSNYDNKTYEELNPVLMYIRGNLTAVESSITMAITMIADINYVRNSFEQVRENSANLTDIITNTTDYADTVRNALISNQRYTGMTQINDTFMADPSSMLEYVNSSYIDIQELYSSANETWKLIEDQTRLIQESNGDVDVFLTTVTTAMGVLAQARATRLASQMITGGRFTQEYAINTEKLQQIQAAVNGYPVQISAITTQLQNAQSITAQTNQTVRMAASLVQQRKEEMAGSVIQAERAKFNATQAQTASLAAQTEVNKFKNLANLTKLDITQSLEDVVVALQSLQTINSDIAKGYEMQANTSAIELRPLQEMLDITGQIDTTVVSTADVEKTLQAAEDGLQVAADAQNVTELAVAESTKALELIEGIQYNLDQSQSLRNQTRVNLQQLQEYNSSVHTIVNEVNAKASDASILETQITRSINNVLTYINDVTQCFADQSLALDNMLIILRAANATTEASGLQALINQNSVMNLTTPLAQKLSELQQSYADINEVVTDVNLLKADLEDITSITDLQRMKNEFTAQRLEMNALETQLSSLEGQLDALLASLDLLNPETTDCNLN